jgi:hypothetical protein
MHTNWIVLPTSPAPPVFNGAIQALLVMGRENSETYGTGGRRVQQQLGSKRMKTDGKTLFLLLFIYFLAETGAGSENADSKTESEYADIQKRINTDREPKN